MGKGFRKSETGTDRQSTMRIGYQRKGMYDRPSDSLVAQNKMFADLVMSECVNCGSKKVTYQWNGFGFCSSHRLNASLFMKAFPSNSDMRRVGLYREAKKE